MAGTPVPYSPTTDVTASGASQPYLSVQASPGAFGGIAAQGEAKLGQGLDAAGGQIEDYAIRQQHMFNEAAVNDAQAKYLDAANGVLHSPPKTDPQGNVIPGSGGFYSTRGDQAMPAYDAAVKTLNDQRAQIAGSLQPGVQQNMFESLTRRLHDFSINDMGRHVDQQVTQAADAKTEALINTTSQTASLAAQSGHLDKFDEAIQQGQAAAQSWGNARGYGQEWGDKYAQKFVGTTVVNSARQMADAGNLQGAAEIVAKYRDQMDSASQLAVDTHLKGAFQDKAANDFAHNLIYGGAAAGATDYGAVGGRIVDIEGTGKNPLSSAQGTGGFTNATWLQTIKAVRPDLAGTDDQDLLKLRANPEVGKAMTTAYAAQNAAVLSDANLPATPGNLYLAHHFGPGGAVKILSTDPGTPIASVVGQDVMRANPDLTGKTVGDIQAQSTQQMAGISPVAAVKQDKALALNQAMSAFSDDPTMQRKAAEAVNRTYASVQMAAASDALQQKQATEKALDGYQQKIMLADEKPLPPDFIHQIATDPSITPEARVKLYDMAQAHMNGAISGETKNYGPGFSDAVRALSLPAGDPGRIASNADALSLYGDNGLSSAGVSKIQSMLTSLQKDPNSAATTKMQTNALDYLKRHISFEDDTAMIKDPVGMDRYNREAVPAFYKAWDDGMSKGMTPAEMLDPKNPKNIIDPIVNMYPKNGPNSVASNINRGSSAPGPTAANVASGTATLPGAFQFDMSKYDTSKPEDMQKAKSDIVAAYNASHKDPSDYAKAHALLDGLTKAPQ